MTELNHIALSWSKEYYGQQKEVFLLPTWLTGAQAREHLKLSKGTFLKLVKDGRITQYTIPGLRDPRYKQEELDALFVAVPKEQAQEDE